MTHPGDPPSSEHSARRQRWFLAAGGLLVIFIALLLARKARNPTARSASTDNPQPAPTAGSETSARDRLFARLPNPRSLAEPARTAGEIVTNKVHQFARNRRDVVHAIGRKFKLEVPDEVERFFAAVEAGRWDEVEGLAKALRESFGHSEDLLRFWPPIHEAWGAVQEACEWPAQKLLDYGNAVLDSLRPGMVYVGGTDEGRWIPTLLNETSEGEHHVVLTQNALADGTYLNYLQFLYNDRLATLAPDDTQRAFSEYLADAQKRLAHDQKFPEEPKQLRPGEDIRVIDGKVQVSGQVAVMAINENLLQALMLKNPDASFALQESFPLRSTYAGAAPLGPLMELRVNDEQHALTAERAAQSVDYWRATAQQLLSDPEASGSSETLESYSKLAMGQANLFAERNFSSEAEQAYRVAMEIHPANVEAAAGLSELLARTGRGDEARRFLEDFARNHPDQRASVATAMKAVLSTARSGQPPRR